MKAMVERTLAKSQRSPDNGELSATEDTQSRYSQAKWRDKDTGHTDRGRQTHPASDSASAHPSR